MKDFYELTVEIQALASAIEGSDHSVPYSTEVVENAGRLAGVIANEGRAFSKEFKPNVGISECLDAHLVSISKKATRPEVAAQIAMLREDLSDLDRPELEVKKWLRDTRLTSKGVGVVRAYNLITLIEDSGLELGESEYVEADNALKTRYVELDSAPTEFVLDTDQIIHVADSLFRLLVENAGLGIFTRKEDILNDNRFITLAEFGTNPSKRSIRSALNQSWDVVTEWFQSVEKGHDIFERTGEARGRAYRLIDPELLSLVWINPVIRDEPEEEKEVVSSSGKLPILNSVDFFSGVLVYEDGKVELGEPERTILAMIGGARSKAISVGQIRDKVSRDFNLSKTDSAVSVTNVINMLGDVVETFYSKKKNKKMVRLAK